MLVQAGAQVSHCPPSVKLAYTLAHTLDTHAPCPQYTAAWYKATTKGGCKPKEVDAGTDRLLKSLKDLLYELQHAAAYMCLKLADNGNVKHDINGRHVVYNEVLLRTLCRPSLAPPALPQTRSRPSVRVARDPFPTCPLAGAHQPVQEAA